MLYSHGSRVSANEQCPKLAPHEKPPLPPPTGLLFSSLAILNLGVMASEPQKPASEKTDAKTAADNTAKNMRDKSGETKTPMDQSNKPEDIKVTQKIRKAVDDR